MGSKRRLPAALLLVPHKHLLTSCDITELQLLGSAHLD